MNASHYIIGDIHSNMEQLTPLLTTLDLRSDDTLIFLGDYIDCLPRSRETVDLLLSLEDTCNCVFLKGNHEFIWEQYLATGEAKRREFLTLYGGRETAKGFGEEALSAFDAGDVDTLNALLQPLKDLIARTKDWHIVGSYIALHAGLLPDQYDQEELVFEEANYFVHPEDISAEKQYLDTYTLVVGHNFLRDEPTVSKGYINIDLGSRHGKYIGALSVEEGDVIRSDGKRFSVAD